MWNNLPYPEAKKKSEPTTWQSIERQRYREDPEYKLYQAERRRCVVTKLYWALMARLGRWMVAVGSRMRTRYGDVALSTQTQEG
jgi:hypothetical protein